MAIVTFALRALPFVAGQWLKKHAIVQHLGQFLPLSIMALLLVNATVGAATTDHYGPWPELVAVGCVALVQWRSRNALFSILLGTAVYVGIRNFGLV